MEKGGLCSRPREPNHVGAYMTGPTAYVVTHTTMISSQGKAWPTSAGVITDLLYLLGRLSGIFHGSGVLVLSGVKLNDLRVEGLGAEWIWSKLEPWTTFRPKDRNRPEIHLCVLDELPARKFDLFDQSTPPHVIARRLGVIRELCGASYRMTPGVVGSAMMRAVHRDPREGRQPRWIDREGVPARMAGPITWKREPNLVETATDGAFAAKLDVRKCYPTAAGTVPLAWNVPTHTPDRPFERGVAGYWLIRPPVLFKGQGPQPCDRNKAVVRKGVRVGVWVTTPIMELYDDLGYHPEVVDAWTAPDVEAKGGPVAPSQRLLRTWSERLAAARKADDGTDPVIAETLKRVGNEAVGLLGSGAGGRIIRVDWQHHIIDQARANLLRKVYARHAVDGVWPLRVSGTDSAWYVTTSVDELPDGTRVAAGMERWCSIGNGALRVVAEMPLDEYTRRSAGTVAAA